MHIRIFTFLLLSLFGYSGLAAQDLITVSGKIRNAESGETLVGATAGAPALKRGGYTDAYGYFSFGLPASTTDSVTLRFVYTGYESVERRVLPDQDLRLDIELSVGSLDEVVIEANSFEEQLKSTEMSVARISMDKAKVIPALFGEVDIIKTLQLKPGINSGSEGSSGIFVRGGGPDQNLVLLDNTVLYNPSHLFGFFSTFNTDAVKDVKLYKAGFPARYGGRLSSVIDVNMKEGNRRKFSGSGGLGLISSRLTLEGPIVKDKASYIVSGRRTYVDIFTRAINEAQEGAEDFTPIPDYFFYDLNAKVNYELSDKDQLFLSGYLGRDRFTFGGSQFDFNFFWGNANGTLRWNHFFNPRLYLNTSLAITDYQYSLSNEFDIFSFDLGSRITDGALRADLTWLPGENHTVRMGVDGIYHRFIVGRLDAGASDGSFDINAGDRLYGSEFGAYISDDWEVNERLQVNAGLRVSGFHSEKDNVLYGAIEPRASARFTVNSKVSLKASYARMVQYLHLVASSGTSLPTDIWYPSTGRVQPQFSDQVALGVTWAINDSWLFSNEVYYKWLTNQIDFRDGADLFVNDDLESEFVFGRGWAYGNEFYLEKTKGRLTGWIGYTLGWTWREFDGTNTPEGVPNPEEDAINDGEPFHPRNDRRHDISVVAIYELNRRWSLSAAWEYRSGDVTTLPPGRIPILGQDLFSGGSSIPLSVPDFVERSNYRLPAYHRLDLGVIIKFFPKWGESDLTISTYNTYNRRNPYFLFIEPVENENGIPVGQQAQQVALFPIIPSVTYNFKF